MLQTSFVLSAQAVVKCGTRDLALLFRGILKSNGPRQHNFEAIKIQKPTKIKLYSSKLYRHFYMEMNVIK